MVQEKKLESRIALITGASRGIGAAVAIRYAREGAHVLLLGRRLDLLERVDDAIQLQGGKATIIPCDLEDFNKLSSLRALLFDRFGYLDIFVANAGILGNFVPLVHMSLELWDQVIKTNLTANWFLLKALDPLLRRSPAGRVIGVTSSAAKTLKAYRGAYAISKRALEGLLLVYAHEMENTSLKVNLIDPGNIATGMRAQAFPGEDPKTLPSPESVTDVFVDFALPICSFHGQTIKAQEWKKD